MPRAQPVSAPAPRLVLVSQLTSTTYIPSAWQGLNGTEEPILGVSGHHIHPARLQAWLEETGRRAMGWHRQRGTVCSPTGARASFQGAGVELAAPAIHPGVSQPHRHSASPRLVMGCSSGHVAGQCPLGCRPRVRHNYQSR